MYIPPGDIAIILMLFSPLLLVYHAARTNRNPLNPVYSSFAGFNRNRRIKGYLRECKKVPPSTQKVFLTEGLTILTVVSVMFILGTKMVFFTAVVSNSMVPTFAKEDLVLAQNIDRSIKPGDIIMFRTPDTNMPVMHRVVDITREGIKTKGDANPAVDWWTVKPEDVMGKAITINGKPIVIKNFGRYFIIDDAHQDFGPFGQDYRKYLLFFEVLKLYGFIISTVSLLLYIAITYRKTKAEVWS